MLALRGFRVKEYSMPISTDRIVSREDRVSFIETIINLGLIENRIPIRIEYDAISIYERDTLRCTGNKWDWKKASDTVRNKYRLEAFLRHYENHL